MGEAQRQEAKVKLVTAMLAGCPWQAAATWAGVQTSRSTAYRLRQAYCAGGAEALRDGRHGHPSKLRAPVLQWLEEYCRGAPGTPSRVVQAALLERFAVRVTIGHLNHVRAALGVGSQAQDVGGKGEGCVKG
jgi:transposase